MGCGLDELARNRSLSAEYPLFTGKGRLAVVGGGHSVVGHVEELRAWQGDIWAINGAWRWCRESGINAMFFSVDPKPELAPLVGGRAVLAPHCDPEAFKAADEAYRAPGPLPGPTSAVAATAVSVASGYDGATFYGCEGSYGETTHVYQDEPVNDLVRVECGGSWLTKLELILQTEQLASVIKRFPERYAERSGGFLAALIRHGDYDITHGTRRMVEGMSMQRFKFQGGRLMRAGDGRDGDGWFPTEEEAREWARPKKRGEVSKPQWDKPTDKVTFLKSPQPATMGASIDWNRKWLSVKADLAAKGFTGSTKAEAIRWARDRGLEVPE